MLKALRSACLLEPRDISTSNPAIGWNSRPTRTASLGEFAGTRGLPAMAADQVPIEFVGRARALRDKILRAEIGYAAMCDKIIAPLRPRPAWPTDRVPLPFLKRVGNAFGKLRSPARVMTSVEITKDGRLKIQDLRASGSTLTFPGWEMHEPSIRLALVMLESPPFEERAIDLAEIGQHAIARRFQRGQPATDSAVIDDWIEIGAYFSDAIRTTASSFEISTRRGGCWRGGLTADGNLIAIRTFVEPALIEAA
jgi:hypothetical protein